MTAWKTPEHERWLDLGCGNDKLPGTIGLDRAHLPGVDVVHNLNHYPWPFEDNAFDHVVCKHSLSHVNDFVAALGEIHRIAKPQAIVEILAPHYASDNANTDPTTRTRMGIRTLNYFCEQYASSNQHLLTASLRHGPAMDLLSRERHRLSQSGPAQSVQLVRFRASHQRVSEDLRAILCLLDPAIRSLFQTSRREVTSRVMR